MTQRREPCPPGSAHRARRTHRRCHRRWYPCRHHRLQCRERPGCRSPGHRRSPLQGLPTRPALPLLVNVTVQGRATHGTQGFKTDATLLYISEADLLREVRHNDGEVQVDLRFQTMRILEGGVDPRASASRPPTAPSPSSPRALADEIDKGQLLNSLMDNSYVAVAVDRVLDLIEGDLIDPAFAQLEQTVAEMEGERASLTYRRGDGLVGVRSERALSDRQEDLVRRVSVLAEARIFPDVNVAEGATWPVAAEHLAILVDPCRRR